MSLKEELDYSISHIWKIIVASAHRGASTLDESSFVPAFCETFGLLVDIFLPNNLARPSLEKSPSGRSFAPPWTLKGEVSL